MIPMIGRNLKNYNIVNSEIRLAKQAYYQNSFHQ